MNFFPEKEKERGVDERMHGWEKKCGWVLVCTHHHSLSFIHSLLLLISFFFLIHKLLPWLVTSAATKKPGKIFNLLCWLDWHHRRLKWGSLQLLHDHTLLLYGVVYHRTTKFVFIKVWKTKVWKLGGKKKRLWSWWREGEDGERGKMKRGEDGERGKMERGGRWSEWREKRGRERGSNQQVHWCGWKMKGWNMMMQVITLWSNLFTAQTSERVRGKRV